MHSLMKSFWSLASHREVFLALFYLIYIRSLYANVEELGFDTKGFADVHQVYASFTPEFQYSMLSRNLNNVMNIVDWMNKFFLKQLEVES